MAQQSVINQQTFHEILEDTYGTKIYDTHCVGDVIINTAIERVTIQEAADAGRTECTICGDEFGDDGHYPVHLLCSDKHIFSRKCILSWVLTDAQFDEVHKIKYPGCPECRHVIVPPAGNTIFLKGDPYGFRITRTEKKYMMEYFEWPTGTKRTWTTDYPQQKFTVHADAAAETARCMQLRPISASVNTMAGLPTPLLLR